MLLLGEVWRHVSGPCSFQLSEKLGRLSSKCAVTHAERTEQKGWPQGEKAIERLNGKKRQHPTNRATQQKLTQQHFPRFVFICYFGDDASCTHSRVERAFTLSAERFLLKPLYPVNLLRFSALLLDITSLFLTFVSIYKFLQKRSCQHFLELLGMYIFIYSDNLQSNATRMALFA